MKLTDIIVTATNSIAPVILTILLGYILMQKGFLNKEFVKVGNKMVFKLCLPVMLFVNVYNIESFASIQWDIVLYCVVAVVVIFAIGLVIAALTTSVPERKGVILQCTFRSNFGLIGLALVSTMAGDSAVAVAAIISTFTIPVFNILSVLALSMYVGSNTDWKKTCRDVLKKIVTNPLIIGIALGMVTLVIRELQIALLGEMAFSVKRDVKFLYTTLNNIKGIASPFSLLVLGAEFEFSSVKGLLKEIAAGTVSRLVLAPVIGIGGVILLSNMGILSCGPDVYPGLVALFGSPVAVSSAIMAGSMGNDKQLATQLVVWTSLLSIVTIFLLVCVLMGMGLIVA